MPKSVKTDFRQNCYIRPFVRDGQIGPKLVKENALFLIDH